MGSGLRFLDLPITFNSGLNTRGYKVLGLSITEFVGLMVWGFEVHGVEFRIQGLGL